MMESASTLEQVTEAAMRLPPLDKLRLIERLASALESDIVAAKPAPKRSLFGAMTDLGPAPSAEEIDEARREAWANFPREDVFIEDKE